MIQCIYFSVFFLRRANVKGPNWLTSTANQHPTQQYFQVIKKKQYYSKPLKNSITQKKTQPAPVSLTLSIPAQSLDLTHSTPSAPPPHSRRLHLPPPPPLIPSPPLIRRRSGARTLVSRGGGGEVHERGVRRARPDGGGGGRVEEGLAAAIRRLRRALRQVRVRLPLPATTSLPPPSLRASSAGACGLCSEWTGWLASSSAGRIDSSRCSAYLSPLPFPLEEKMFCSLLWLCNLWISFLSCACSSFSEKWS